MLPTSPIKPDIEGRVEIEQLVNAFYERVRGDEVLAPIFNEIAGTDWVNHLPKMYSFWETVLFRTGNYRGNPLAAHARLVTLTDMGRDKFDRWLTLFISTVDALFAGERADHIKSCATDMANVIYSRINQVPDPRFDPANLSEEQRERYSRYRETTGTPSQSDCRAASSGGVPRVSEPDSRAGSDLVDPRSLRLSKLVADPNSHKNNEV